MREHRRHGGLVAFGDDGEKFGVWPEHEGSRATQNGWLEPLLRITDARTRDWLQTRADDGRGARRRRRPLGTCYLPDGSVPRDDRVGPRRPKPQRDLRAARGSSNSRARNSSRLRSVRPGRLLAKLPREATRRANAMYARMLEVSERVVAADGLGIAGDTVSIRPSIRSGSTTPARSSIAPSATAPYWHGAFGGLYLPHLRNAVYGAPDSTRTTCLETAAGRPTRWRRGRTGRWRLRSRRDESEVRIRRRSS